MKYAVITFGCRVNQADSLGFEEGLIAGGGAAVSPEQAEVVVVNTCSVTASADQGARQVIRRIARVNPAARIVVTGCYATRRPEEIRTLPGVERVLHNERKSELVSIVRTIPLARSTDFASTTATRFGDGDGACGAAIEPGVAGRTAFTLRVQTGCAEPCTYCIITSTRGIPRSVPVSSILLDVERVHDAGFKEIALTGVHLGSYGRDLVPPSSLLELLDALLSLQARFQSDLLFRISSLEPMDCTSEIVDRVAGSRCFAPHFHLPLQHASDRLLSAMRRPYTIEQYQRLVEQIRRRLPDAAIGSDVIVGFPGETDEEFERLAAFLESSPLTHVHVFPYSDRPGTAAATIPAKVPGLTIRERARRIREISSELGRRFRESQVGTIHRALTLDDGALAVTGNYLKLRIPPGQARNQWVRLTVTSHHHGELLSG
jgi:threonylcarbamoyladenosine tRNA methylthiotransferase MtaB